MQKSYYGFVFTTSKKRSIILNIFCCCFQTSFICVVFILSPCACVFRHEVPENEIDAILDLFLFEQGIRGISISIRMEFRELVDMVRDYHQDDVFGDGLPSPQAANYAASEQERVLFFKLEINAPSLIRTNDAFVRSRSRRVAMFQLRSCVSSKRTAPPRESSLLPAAAALTR